MPELRDHCKNHPILEADGRCASCWGFFCDACLEDVGEHRYCEKCAPAALESHEQARVVVQDEKRRLDLRLLMYVLILLLGVVIGGSIIMFNGGLDQFFGAVTSNYQVLNKPRSMDDKLAGFQATKTEHFNIYFHNADMADAVSRVVEDRFSSILGDMLVFQKDVLQRGPFNIVIVKDNAEFLALYPDALPNRVAMTDYETKAIVIVEENEGGNVLIDLTHELTHAIMFERMSGGTAIPNWMHEGLSSYEEARYDSSQVDARWATFGRDIAQGGGKPLASLAVSDQATADEVNSYYAESHSVVSFMIKNYGMLKFMKMTAKLQSGEGVDGAIKSVYAPDLISLNDLQQKWQTAIRI